MIGRCGYARTASFIDWSEDLFMGSMTTERYGHGTQSVPYSLTIFGNDSHNTTAEVRLRILLSGVLKWSLAVSTELFADFGIIDVLNANLSLATSLGGRSGIASISGEMYVSKGMLVRVKHQKNGSISENLDTITTSFWIAP